MQDRSYGAGQHVVRWDGRSDGGERVASGVYLLRFVVEGETGARHTESTKMVLIK